MTFTARRPRSIEVEGVSHGAAPIPMGARVGNMIFSSGIMGKDPATDKLPEDENIASASYQTTSVYGHGHPLYYENVVKVMRGQAEPETDGREGLKSLEVLVAAYLAARDGKRVALPLDY
jgi:predicted dehydrogenase